MVCLCIVLANVVIITRGEHAVLTVPLACHLQIILFIITNSVKCGKLQFRKCVSYVVLKGRIKYSHAIIGMIFT